MKAFNQILNKLAVGLLEAFMLIVALGLTFGAVTIIFILTIIAIPIIFIGLLVFSVIALCFGEVEIQVDRG